MDNDNFLNKYSEVLLKSVLIFAGFEIYIVYKTKWTFLSK